MVCPPRGCRLNEAAAGLGRRRSWRSACGSRAVGDVSAYTLVKRYAPEPTRYRTWSRPVLSGVTCGASSTRVSDSRTDAGSVVGTRTSAVAPGGTSTRSSKRSPSRVQRISIAPRTDSCRAAGVGEPAGVGPDAQVAVAGGVRALAESGDPAVEPFADRAERVVVEGVHGRRLEAALGGPAVPALPHGGGAVAQGEEPGGVVRTAQQRVYEVGPAVRVQDGGGEGDAEEAGGEGGSGLFDQFGEAAGGGGREVGGEECEGECDEVAGLGVAFDPYGGHVGGDVGGLVGGDLGGHLSGDSDRDELFGEHGTDGVGQFPVPPRGLPLPQDVRGQGGDPGTVGEVRGGDDVARGGGAGREPVGEVRSHPLPPY